MREVRLEHVDTRKRDGRKGGEQNGRRREDLADGEVRSERKAHWKVLLDDVSFQRRYFEYDTEVVDRCTMLRFHAGDFNESDELREVENLASVL